MNDLPAGSFEVSADAAQGTAVLELPLADGEAKTGVVLSLSGRVTLKGQAVALDGAAPVPGMRVTVRSRKGPGWSARYEDPDKNDITDEAGRFTVQSAPAGPVIIFLAPVDWQGSDYGYANVPAEAGDGPVTDVGQLAVPRRRTTALERSGDLGFTLQASQPGTEPSQIVFTVAVVRADGPAASAGLREGDVIVSVDGHDVTGAQSYLYSTLSRVPSGTAVALGLKRGGVVSITAATPP
jgi:hypothetical protein